MGRPSIFTETVADEICERLGNGESLRSICCDEAMPAQRTVIGWLAKGDNDPAEYPEFAEFVRKYIRAREVQADTIFDEILDIADDGSNDWMERRDGEGNNLGWKENGEALQRSRLRVDARKWMAGKLSPRKYGEKTLIGSDPDNPLPQGFNVNLVKANGDAG